ASAAFLPGVDAPRELRQALSVDLVVDGAPRVAEHLRGAGTIPLALLQNPPAVPPLPLFEAYDFIVCFQPTAVRHGREDVGREMSWFQQTCTLRVHQAPLQYVPQLADVARPIVPCERDHGRVGDPDLVSPEARQKVGQYGV